MAGASGTDPQGSPKPAAEAGNGGGAGGGTEGAKAPAWHEQLPPELKGNAGLAEYQKVGDMAKALLDLKGKAGVNLPGEKAGPEELAAFWEKLGRPKEAGAYSFAKDRENAEIARMAHAANLTESQAAALFQQLKTFGASRMQETRQAQTAELAETEQKLKAEFGSRYAEKVEFLKRGLAAAGRNVGAALQNAGIAGNPDIVRAFIRYGELTAESGGARGGSAERQKSLMEGGTFGYQT
ncbi:MAG: hypothetical protein LBK27_05570 [Treponema sp.]|jgi:hypothetical protein|nr:hypothetical protein [Treponema sp.]